MQVGTHWAERVGRSQRTPRRSYTQSTIIIRQIGKRSDYLKETEKERGSKKMSKRKRGEGEGEGGREERRKRREK